MNKLIALTLLTLTASTGCAVRVARPNQRVPAPPPPVIVTTPAPAPAPPPAPVVHRMSGDEAIQRAVNYAHSRGYQARVKKAHLTGNDVWKVKLLIDRADAEGKLDVDLNAWSREIIRAQENVRYRKHHVHDHHHDHDDDDDEKGKGKDKKHKGKGKGRPHAASAVADARGR